MEGVQEGRIVIPQFDIDGTAIAHESDRAVFDRIAAVVCRVTCPPYGFRLIYRPGGSVALQGMYEERDVHTGAMAVQHTRVWLLTGRMTDSEIVQTCLKCVLTSAEHRIREHFRYRGHRIFGPHFDVEDLVRLCEDGRNDAGGRQG